MTAPTRTAGRGGRSGQTERERTEQRTRERANPRGRARSAAAERAYARKQERGQRQAAPATERRPRKDGPATAPTRPARTRPAVQREAARRLQRPIATARRLQEKVTTSRGSFVIAVMTVLAAGIIGTLWLSVAAVSNSYELRQAAAEVNRLSERKETLVRRVAELNSTPALQRRAEKLGMVPGPDPAHLVKQPDGRVRMVGEPKAAKAPKPPAPKPPKPAPPNAGAAPQQQRGQDGAQRQQAGPQQQSGQHPGQQTPPPARDNAPPAEGDGPAVRASGGR